MRFLFTSYYPYAIAVAFLTFLFWMKVPRKGVFLSRALIALLIATFLAHVNRIFDLWPAHLLFPSGHAAPLDAADHAAAFSCAGREHGDVAVPYDVRHSRRDSAGADCLWDHP
jgi:hypothetical protein